MGKTFPSVETATHEGLLAVGGSFEPSLLFEAYSEGIFPWPIEGVQEVLWFSPPKRGLLFLTEVHRSRSFEKFLRQTKWTVTFDQDFSGVIRGCYRFHGRRGGTWLRPDMIKAYENLHKEGHAHSAECRDENGTLIGGVYGVSIGGMFAAESMYHDQPNASKMALAKLLGHLQHQHVEWLDVQVVNQFTESFGARAIRRSEFMILLKQAIQRQALKF